ncbi:hypothetical protein FOBRF1_001548 [Fusarium oxysporum]
MTGRAVPSQPEFLAEWSTLMAAENGTRILQQLGIGISPDNTRGRGILDLQVHSGPDLLADPDDGMQVQTAYSLVYTSRTFRPGQLELRGQDYERRIPYPNHLADPPRACRRVPKHASSDWRSSASDTSSYLPLLPDAILRLAA